MFSLTSIHLNPPVIPLVSILSNSSKEWATLSKAEKEKLQHQSAEDGEFWLVVFFCTVTAAVYYVKLVCKDRPHIFNHVLEEAMSNTKIIKVKMTQTCSRPTAGTFTMFTSAY